SREISETRGANAHAPPKRSILLRDDRRGFDGADFREGEMPSGAAPNIDYRHPFGNDVVEQLNLGLQEGTDFGPPRRTPPVRAHQKRNFSATCTFNGSPGPMPGEPRESSMVSPILPSPPPTRLPGCARFTRSKMLNISIRN